MNISKLSSANVETYAIKNGSNMLCGLITKERDGRFKIELMMKWVHFESTQPQACAWVRGAMTIIEQ